VIGGLPQSCSRNLEGFFGPDPVTMMTMMIMVVMMMIVMMSVPEREFSFS